MDDDNWSVGSRTMDSNVDGEDVSYDHEVSSSGDELRCLKSSDLLGSNLSILTQHRHSGISI